MAIAIVDPDKLDAGLTAIADAIRGKTGGTEPLSFPEGMAAEVDAVFESGKKAEYDAFWDGFQDHGQRNMWPYAFGGAGWNIQTFKPKYPIVVGAGLTPAMNMFNFFNASPRTGIGSPEPFDFSELSGILDFSNATNLTNTFESSWIRNLTVDFGNATSMRYTFAMGNGGYIDGLTIRVTEKCMSFSNAFYFTKTLTELRFTEDSLICASLDLQWPQSLSRESITSVIDTLSAAAEGLTVTFSLAAVNTAFETAEGAADGSTSAEWLALADTKSSWTISLV